MGLKGRRLEEFDATSYWRPTHVASADRRTTEGEWPVATVAAHQSEIIAELCSPVLRLFQFTECNSEFVEGLAPRFIK